ncbi:putative acyltransferase [Legionella beliardensis]|uniref:Putative acyltransferase n=1 Tax=Legionella beliardensis TaxID=91822 RepID=A0A378I1Y8_9GAMM|nr:acyltransferase [Legionella beliardensis]STX28656.1 putative acyltransferase [Legionella beliardensis]
MRQKRGSQWHGVLSILVLITSTIIFFIPILIMGLLKLFPNLRFRIFCTKLIDTITTYWSSTNNWYIRLTKKVRWEVNGLDNLSDDNWYLVVANHQSWLDIVVLQYVLNRKIPVLKFFIKDQLKWVPLLGFAWWAMGCPFMKRYSKEYLTKNPHKRGKDLESTNKAMTLFKNTPSAVMNFIEGTRFTAEKKTNQKSPYHFLLKPKAGGISFVIAALENRVKSITDLTIVYSSKKPTLWNFLCHRIDTIYVKLRQIPIPAKFFDQSLIHNEHKQLEFRNWLNEQWEEKDKLIKGLQVISS